MSIYIDHEFETTTLESLLIELAEVATNAWYHGLEDFVLHSYRDLAAKDVGAGRTSPADHPGIPVGWFTPSTYDTVSASTVELWEDKLRTEVGQTSSLFVAKVKP